MSAPGGFQLQAQLWLIDGYNLLHAVLITPDERKAGWWTREMRERVVERVTTAPNETGAPIWIVFDGSDEREEPPAPERPGVVFATSADQWILKRVRAADDPATIAVVTADRPLAARAAHRGAHIVAPRDFLTPGEPDATSA